jgi:hypothetical protein
LRFHVVRPESNEGKRQNNRDLNAFKHKSERNLSPIMINSIVPKSCFL